MKLRQVQRTALAVAAVACMASLAFAQDWTAGGNEQPKVEVAPVAPVKVAPGGKSTVAVNFRVRPRYHINSNQPGSDMLIPTVLKLDAPTDVLLSTIYPEGKDMAFSFSPGKKLNVYSGDFQVNTRVMVQRKMRPGKYRVHGSLHYQACDARACYPPTELPVAFDVRVMRPSSGHTRRNPAQSPHAR